MDAWRQYLPGKRVRDMKVDASSIHLETPLNPSVSCTHVWRRPCTTTFLFLRAPRRFRIARAVGQVANLSPIRGALWARRAPAVGNALRIIVLRLATLYYNILVSSRAATILLWGRMASCGRLPIGQMALTPSTPRFAACRVVGQDDILRPIGNRPNATNLQHSSFAACRYAGQVV
jgi:hypothetical protein